MPGIKPTKAWWSRTQIFPLGHPCRGREAGELYIGFCAIPKSRSDVLPSLTFLWPERDVRPHLPSWRAGECREANAELGERYWLCHTKLQPSRRIDHLLKSPLKSDRTGFSSQLFYLITCMPHDSLFNLSKPQFLHVWNGNNHNHNTYMSTGLC